MNFKKEYGGYFTVGEVNDGVIEKRLRFHSTEEEFLFNNVFHCSQSTIERYYRDLLSANVLIPKTKVYCDTSNEIHIRQTFVCGFRLVDWIKHADCIDSLNFHLQYFKKLLEYQRSVFVTNRYLRIDFNLQNFVIKDEELFLVDIVPPIYVNTYVTDNSINYTKKIERLLRLYSFIDWQIIAMIGYWIQEKIESFKLLDDGIRKLVLSTIINEFLEEANNVLCKYTNYNIITKDYIYLNRSILYFYKIYVIYEYIDNYINYSNMLMKFLYPPIK